MLFSNTFPNSDSGKFPRDLTISAIKNDLLKLIEDEYNFENFNYLDISSHGNILEQRNLSTLACFVDGKPIRFEDYSRKFDNLILYKGSFNPVHIGHLKIAEDAKNRCPNSIVVFAISRDTYQKGRISNKELIKRIKDINDHGYMAMVFDSGFFYDNYLAVSKRFSGKTHIALGVDSFNRLVKCYENEEFSEIERENIENLSINEIHQNKSKEEVWFKNNFGDAHFYVYGRRQEVYVGTLNPEYTYVDFDVDVSSTTIRQLMESGNSEEAKKFTGKGE